MDTNILNSLILPAKIDNLQKFIDLVNSCGIKFGLNKERIYELMLAVEEALVNIFNYAYPNHQEGYVELICYNLNSKKLIIEIKDYGIPFDPNSVKEPDMTSDIMIKEIGGIGIYLIKRLVDEFHYCRNNNINILKLVVYK